MNLEGRVGSGTDADSKAESKVWRTGADFEPVAVKAGCLGTASVLSMDGTMTADCLRMAALAITGRTSSSGMISVGMVRLAGLDSVGMTRLAKTSSVGNQTGAGSRTGSGSRGGAGSAAGSVGSRGGAGSGADSVGSRGGAGSGADSVGSRGGAGSGADSVGSRGGAGSGVDSVGSRSGVGSGADSVCSRTGADSTDSGVTVAFSTSSDLPTSAVTAVDSADTVMATAFREALLLLNRRFNVGGIRGT